jgi:drug/metabolite transporter (DMT)-like permease
MPLKHSIWRAHLALLLVNMLYGAGHILAKGVMPAFLTPTTFIFFRILGATLLFWLIKAFLPKERIQRKDIGLFMLCALFGVTINQLFFFHGLSLSSSINSGIIMTTNPILVTIIAYFLLKEKITATKVTGIVLGATGAILLSLAGNTGKGDSTLGDLFLFINAASYAVYLVIAKPLMQRYSPFTVITYVFTFGLFYMLIYPPTYIDIVQIDFSAIHPIIWAKITYIVIGVTFFTYLLTMYGLKYVGPSIASAYIYTQPVLVMGFAYLFSLVGIADDYTNTITLEKIGYMVMIFAGVWITAYYGKKNRDK